MRFPHIPPVPNVETLYLLAHVDLQVQLARWHRARRNVPAATFNGLINLHRVAIADPGA